MTKFVVYIQGKLYSVIESQNLGMATAEITRKLDKGLIPFDKRLPIKLKIIPK